MDIVLSIKPIGALGQAGSVGAALPVCCAGLLGATPKFLQEGNIK